MLLGRFGVIVPIVAIAGSFAKKNTIPQSESTFPTDRISFAILLFLIVFIIGALTFFPSLALGPLVEHLLMLDGQTF